SLESPMAEPCYNEPCYPPPCYNAAPVGQPVYGQPVYGQPGYCQPIGQPSYGLTTTQPLFYQQPVVVMHHDEDVQHGCHFLMCLLSGGLTLPFWISDNPSSLLKAQETSLEAIVFPQAAVLKQRVCKRDFIPDTILHARPFEEIRMDSGGLDSKTKGSSPGTTIKPDSTKYC
ncbi:unnamed protein product, partial [Didymodactylos carnosus]